jgi:hypothetical protein
VYGFQWSITQYESVIKENGRSYQVIDMTANAEMCYVSPHRSGATYFEGDAIITVSHPKTSYKLDIRVRVTDQTDIMFAQQYVTMNQYTQLTVGVTASSSSRLSYTSTNSQVVSVEGTDKLCVLDAKKEGTAIIIVTNMTGTKSSELIVRVNPVDLNDYFYLKTESNILNLITNGGHKTLYGQVINAKTGEKNEELTNNLMWKIKDSDQGKGVVKLNNLPAANSVVKNPAVNVYPAKSGEAEIIMGFFDADNSLLTRYPTLKDNCMGKSIYVQVEASQTQFVTSHSVISMNEGDTVSDVWARVDNMTPAPNYGNWISGGEIMWQSENTDIATVSYLGSGSSRSNVMIKGKKPGSVQIFVNYGSTTEVISVVVKPNSYISSTNTNITVMPDQKERFVITSNPTDKNITVTIDTNGIILVRGRRKGESSWSSNNNINISYTGSSGYEIEVEALDKEGVVRIMFEMKDTGAKLEVTIQNIKNYYVKWVNKSQMRIKPNEKDPVNLRLYYEINPRTDELVPYVHSNFRTVVGKESNGDKYIDFLPPYKNLYEGDVSGTFIPCGVTVTMYTRDTNEGVPLDVFIYYDSIPVEFQFDKTVFVSGNHEIYFSQPGNLMSYFDPVNSAIVVAQLERMNLKISNAIDTTYKGHNIWYTSTFIPAATDDNFLSCLHGGGLNLSMEYFSSEWPLNINQVTNRFVDVKYAGLLDIEYRYYNGNKGLMPQQGAEFHKKVLVYAADVSRKKN